MYNDNKTQDYSYDPMKLAIHSILRAEADLISNCGNIFTKTVFFYNLLHFIDEENIVNYVDIDCGSTFYPEAPTKVEQFNQEWKNISRSCEKPKCVTYNDQHNCSIDEKHTSNIFLNPYNSLDMDPADLKPLN